MNKKQDIIAAAERLFYNNGFHATSTDRICSEAGVSTRTLYKYFPSRERLTGEVMAQRQARFFAALHPPEHPEAVSHLFTTLERWLADEGAQGCFFLKAWGEYALQDEQLAAQALGYRYEMRHYLTTCVCHYAGEDSNTADALWMLFEGAATSALILGPSAARRAGDAAVRLLNGREQRR